MHKAARQKQIRELLTTNGDASVAFLAERFGASLNTIRRDLTDLDSQGHVSRTRGGAIFEREARSPLTGPDYAVRVREHPAQKVIIGEHAAALIDNGSSFLMSGGTTMHALAVALAGHEELQIVTNGLTVAMELEKCRSSRVFLIGGVVDFTKMSTVGQAAQDALRDIVVDQAFIGVSGLTADGGMAMFNPQEAEVNRAFIQAARYVTVLADSTKFESKAMFKICSLDQVDRLITDDGISDRDRSAIEALGIELIIVGRA
ncbi:DeoR/GlpR family DNA-binding transcription regulator [Pseudomonas sp. MWU16-30317]|uniref:DeoR/GlpR family DNA-binding transcription regulator n=1 Tax=Pseudomonas sp. MWU16-30317 TaxID=2878095 RepID=UPI001CFA7AEF|nr:DeoR/GlpR family DNA-binding transcription regulator [Pseudomonas sp. MWU16-30317]